MKKSLFALLLTVLSFSFASAQSDNSNEFGKWQEYKSETDRFSIELPEGATNSSEPLQAADGSSFSRNTLEWQNKDEENFCAFGVLSNLIPAGEPLNYEKAVEEMKLQYPDMKAEHMTLLGEKAVKIDFAVPGMPVAGNFAHMIMVANPEKTHLYVLLFMYFNDKHQPMADKFVSSFKFMKQ